ncbi:MAG: hypothetical protein U0521_16320 [Anaerolineae bacterium]
MIDAAARGKQIFCEKPMALTLAQTDARLPRSSGRACCVRSD